MHPINVRSSAPNAKFWGRNLSPLLLVLGLAACGSPSGENADADQPETAAVSDDTAPAGSAWVAYSGEGWQISAPPDWTPEPSPEEQTVLVLLPPSTPGKGNDAAPEHFTLTAVDLSLITSERLRTLEGMIESNLATMGLLIPEWKLERQADVQLDGQPSVHLTYTGQAGPHAMRWDQWYAVHQSKAWILNFGCGVERYTLLAPAVYAMVEGFGW